VLADAATCIETRTNIVEGMGNPSKISIGVTTAVAASAVWLVDEASAKSFVLDDVVAPLDTVDRYNLIVVDAVAVDATDAVGIARSRDRNEPSGPGVCSNSISVPMVPEPSDLVLAVVAGSHTACEIKGASEKIGAVFAAIVYSLL
jgi:hypothetical protein